MDEFVEVGKIINTFGIKGELKVNSDFEYKDRIFINNFSVYIGYEKIKELINTHRVHKNYDLLTFKDYNNINEVLKYKGKSLYIKRKDLNLKEDEYLLKDLIGCNVYDNDILLGVVIDYEKSLASILLKIKGDKIFYIPLIKEYIKKVQVLDKKILTNKGSDLIL